MKANRKTKVDTPEGKIHYKQKYEFRQKNLTCPHKHYHMKVQFRDLMQHRPSCPACGAAMLVKEELKEVSNGHYTVDQVVEESNIRAYLV